MSLLGGMEGGGTKMEWDRTRRLRCLGASPLTRRAGMSTLVTRATMSYE